MQPTFNILTQDQENRIKNNHLLQSLKKLDYIKVVTEINASLTDETVIGAMVNSSSTIRKPYTIERLQARYPDCKVTDHNPNTSLIKIRFHEVHI